MDKAVFATATISAFVVDAGVDAEIGFVCITFVDINAEVIKRSYLVPRVAYAPKVIDATITFPVDAVDLITVAVIGNKML